ncbi:MAG TPA: hypothetical protein VJX16_13985 [Terriglobales bacterium]|nr:hypothetical protein [Terriglobales bacterium]
MKNKNKRELEKHWAEQAKKLSKKPANTSVRLKPEVVNQTSQTGREPAGKD